MPLLLGLLLSSALSLLLLASHSSSSSSSLHGCSIALPDLAAMADCGLANPPKSSLKLAMQHRDAHPLHHTPPSRVDSLHPALLRDSSRLRGIALRTKASSQGPGAPSPAPSPSFVGGKDSPAPFQPPAHPPLPSGAPIPHSLHSSVQSGVTLGSGEYFMDVFIGSPPRHFSLIIDTGSDLTWVQCNPCRDCYEQEGPMFSPNSSSSYSNIACSQAQCQLVYNVNEQPCVAQNPHACKYLYWYGDKSNTTGDLALETFTLNLTNGQPFSVDDIVFGCGHTNEGLFRGAGGLVGLGKGPLSFASQLHERYGRKFSYCLENRNDNLSVSSILTFGEDEALGAHPDLQYTSFVKNTSVETFYYLEIDKVSVGGKDVAIPPTAWSIDAQGNGGAIIDSGTTLTYLASPAYQPIVKAFESQISYPRTEDPLLNLCYDVSGVSPVQFPELSFTFKDGAVFKPPLQNYFIEMDENLHTVCLAILENPSGSLTILGNFLQQNVHFLYDLGNSRLGFAHMACAAD